MQLNENIMTLIIFLRHGHKTEICMPTDEAETVLAGLSYKMGDLRPDTMKLHGFINTPLIVKRTVIVNPQEVIGIELTECPQVQFTMTPEEL